MAEGDSALGVELREPRGKGAARRLREQGRIPGVVYGPGLETVSVSLDPSHLDRIVQTGHAGINTLIDLTGAPEVSSRTVMIKELQRDPVYGALVHADLYQLDLTERQRVSVPIHLTGTAVGVTMGGLLDHSLRELEVECLARSIPDEIVIDVSKLEQGHSLHVSDLVLPEGVDLHTAGDLPVVSVVAPKEEEGPEVAEAGEEVAEGEAPAAEGEEKDERASEGDDSSDS